MFGLGEKYEESNLQQNTLRWGNKWDSRMATISWVGNESKKDDNYKGHLSRRVNMGWAWPKYHEKKTKPKIGLLQDDMGKVENIRA